MNFFQKKGSPLQPDITINLKSKTMKNVTKLHFYFESSKSPPEFYRRSGRFYRRNFCVLNLLTIDHPKYL